ncbi:transcription factor BIM1-like isoform X4 [Juglans microcarpa x Juglans regia]|uniref:transcription factor BIM1-like isoform X4 n=1 Tax=Juglans microcarpa x Juglans regia TaxID=2249226 RepID=UPI001B7E1054|nr:transcription factor BIM1-like isoform X4 [Juglans microcarpa x Juglans regia]
MEHPQPRPSKTEGRKPTQDFLSLYSRSDVQQDPSPPSQGGYLKTHDFLQPLERIGKSTGAKEESVVEISAVERPPPPAPRPLDEHILPGGIGTYSISHISGFNQTLVPKPDGSIFTVARAGSSDRNDENSNCSTSYTAGGFTLWEESHALKKGKTRKENMGEKPAVREAGPKLRQRTKVEGPSQSSTNNHHCNSFSSLSSSEAMEQSNKSFVDVIKSAKGITLEDDLDDEEETFVPKKEPSAIVATTHKGELKVKVDGKISDQKANTPRSKHSATEQRRRSKINDRFQMLRELIPLSDQKRDKASFLFEVIEYIQFLQEKVEKYEGAYQGWNHEPAKLMPWRNNHRPAESHVDQSRMDHHPGITNQAVTLPMSPEPSFFTTVKSGAAVHEILSKLASDADNILSQPQPRLCETRSGTNGGIATSDKLKEQELTVEDGTISISSVYSQRLLSTLTQALQNSGVDLSRASISVQIELGKQSNSRVSAIKDIGVPSGKQGTTCTRVANDEDSDRDFKKLKTGKT